jgi:hypothetical protein
MIGTIKHEDSHGPLRERLVHEWRTAITFECTTVENEASSFAV